MIVNAQLGNLYGYIGSVDGLIKAWADPHYHEDFLDELIDEIETTFVVDTIVAKNKTEYNLNHMFEWNESGGGTSDLPLFKLVTTGVGSNKFVGVSFLPSTVNVPLPDPKYGIDEEVISNLERHTFRLKAFVMETRSMVQVRTNKKHGLFIPSMKSDKGYVMGKKSVKLNPGGNSTGQFTAWWNAWFETRGEAIARKTADVKQYQIKKTGQIIIRSNTTGRIISPGKSGLGIIKAVSAQAEAEAIRMDRNVKRRK